MATIDPEGFHALVNAAITAVSILGGAMAYASGYAAAQGLIERCDREELSARINEGIGRGFIAGVPLALLTLMIERWI